MVAKTEVEVTAWAMRVAQAKAVEGSREEGERTSLLSSSLSLYLQRSSRHCHLVAYLVCLAGGDS
jgi:hypothetical protein